MGYPYPYFCLCAFLEPYTKAHAAARRVGRDAPKGQGPKRL